MEDILNLIVGRSAWTTAQCLRKPVAETEACERGTPTEWSGSSSAGRRLKSADVEKQCRISYAKMERQSGWKWGVEYLGGCQLRRKDVGHGTYFVV